MKKDVMQVTSVSNVPSCVVARTTPNVIKFPDPVGVSLGGRVSSVTKNVLMDTMVLTVPKYVRTAGMMGRVTHFLVPVSVRRDIQAHSVIRHWLPAAKAYRYRLTFKSPPLGLS